MSYTPEDQMIDPTIEELQKNIKVFNEIATNRILSKNYTTEHSLKLQRMVKNLFDLSVDLNNL